MKGRIPANDRYIFARFLAELSAATTTTELLRLRTKLNGIIQAAERSVSDTTLEQMLGILNHRTSVFEVREKGHGIILARFGYPRRCDTWRSVQKTAYEAWFPVYTQFSRAQLVDVRREIDENLKHAQTLVSKTARMYGKEEARVLQDELIGKQLAERDASRELAYREKYRELTDVQLGQEEARLSEGRQGHDKKLRRRAIAYLLLEEFEVVPLIVAALP